MENKKKLNKLKKKRIIYLGICLSTLFLSGFSFGVSWITSGAILLVISSIFGHLLNKIKCGDKEK